MEPNLSVDVKPCVMLLNLYVIDKKWGIVYEFQCSDGDPSTRFMMFDWILFEIESLSIASTSNKTMAVV